MCVHACGVVFCSAAFTIVIHDNGQKTAGTGFTFLEAGNEEINRFPFLVSSVASKTAHEGAL